MKKDVKASIFCEEKEAEPPSMGHPDPVLLTMTRQENGLKNDFPVNIRSLEFRNRYFPETSLRDWNNWQWQIRNSYTSYEQIQQFLHLSEDEVKPSGNGNNLPIRITPYYASLLDPYDALQPLRRTVIPVLDELITSPEEKPDPLGEMNDSPVNHIVHRYPDRVLFLVTGFCSTYCRYCTRSHMVSKKDKCHAMKSEWDEAIGYIQQHPEVRDVVISGGDPLTLPESRLQYLLSRLRAISHVEIIRIGTKVPAVLPMRITPPLLRMIRQYHPVFMSIHFTHPDELTPEVCTACERIADAGIPMGSQTVLLRGINDDPVVFRKLMQGLLKIRVRPYYLYQCDPIPGSAHFRTHVEKGLDIIRSLRGFTSGYAIPHFVIDAPGGGGKIPLLPEYFQGRSDGRVVLTNYEGNTYYYPDPD
ncbi:MAG: KamA family radical SAM protein [Bacteroidales bacterium]|nr:KamA family radical SAM protein [Bacteroidales bacterium]